MLLLYLIQDFLLFHPTPLPASHSFTFKQPFKELNISVGERNLNVVKFLPGGKPEGIVLYFHGNMRNVERYAPFSEIFTKNNYEVWMPDYPGFGKTTGKHTEETMYKDAALIYDLAIKETTADNIIIYGKSLGTGVAAQLASRNASKKLILETAYYSVPSIAQNKFPVYPAKFLMRYTFPTYQFLPNVAAPVALFHGTRDEVINYKQATRLKKENPAINLITIEGGKHNNLAQYEVYKNKMDSLLKH